jgi:hypothetical protein
MFVRKTQAPPTPAGCSVASSALASPPLDWGSGRPLQVPSRSASAGEPRAKSLIYLVVGREGDSSNQLLDTLTEWNDYLKRDVPAFREPKP